MKKIGQIHIDFLGVINNENSGRSNIGENVYNKKVAENMIPFGKERNPRRCKKKSA